MSTAKRTSQVIQATDELLSPRISYNGTNIISPQTADMSGDWKLNGKPLLTEVATFTVTGSTANWIIGANSDNTTNEYKELIAGSNVSIVHATRSITISSTISGGSGVSSSEVASISSNLQSQIYAISGASTSSLLNGYVVCNTTDKSYYVTYPSAVMQSVYPQVSLIVPTSGSAISVLGVYGATTTGFNVILTAIPETTGYLIPWSVSTSGSYINNSGSGSGLQKYVSNIGDGVSTSIVVSHNLNSLDVIPFVYKNSTNGSVDCYIETTTVNSITLTFSVAPSSNEYRTVIIG